MERNAIVATVLVIMILLGYQWYLSRFESPPQEPARPTTTAPAPQPTAPPPATGQPAPAPAPVKASPKPKGYTPTAQVAPPTREVVVETPLMRVTLSTAGARVTSWQLKKYHAGNGAPVDLVAMKDSGGWPGPLSAWADGEHAQAVYEVDRERLDLFGRDETGTVTFTEVSPAGIELQKKLTFHADRYQAEVDLRVRNLSGADAAAEPRLAWGPGLRNSLDKKHSTLQAPTLWLNGKRVHEDLSKANGEKAISGDLSWTALQDTYFAAALVPKDKGLQAFVKKAAEDQPLVGLQAAKQILPAGGEISISALVFAGPKDLDVLKGAGHDLDQLVDLGIFDTIYLVTAALWLLKFLYRFTGNYGIAIILVTVLQKIAFHPLTVKSLKSMRAMQEIQPKVQALQERYKNNPKKKQEETMALYKKHGVNPMGGCLPMLVQIPIFIALYNALSASVEMWQARFLWIRDLTQPDSLFTMSLWGGYEFHGNILGLLMGVSMWVQQKMSPPAGDPRQAQMMLWMMPILFTFMFWSFPSGLVLYWLVNNVLQIGQQWLITRSPARPAPAEGQAA
jgi:YidC/Oxa1 family membrane protein insertase